MGFAPNLEGLLAVASAVPLMVLGLALLFLRPPRAENTHFAAFAVCWGAQISTANLSRLTSEPALHDALFRASLALFPPTALFLAYFASLHPQRGLFAKNLLTASLLALPALGGLLVLLLQPNLVIADTQLFHGRPVSIYGPATVPLFFAPFYGAFYYALWRQFSAARADQRGVTGKRARLVFMALALFTSYLTTRTFLVFAIPQPVAGIQPANVVLSLNLLFAVGFALVLAVALLILFKPPLRGDIDWAMATSLLAPAAFACLERALEFSDVFFETGSVWRIGTVALVVYAVARYQLFDLDLRLRRVAVSALPIGLVAFTLAVLIRVAAGDPPLWTLGGALVFGIAGNLVVWQFRGQLADLLLPRGTADPDYLYHRKLEVYRAALERSLVDPLASPMTDELRRLRRNLGIDEREHNVLEFVVRTGLGSRGTPPEAPPRVEPGALLLNRYRVDRLLGEGAHGRAYLARDEKLDRPVVVKAVGTTLLGGRAARLLLREAKMAGSLEHPNIVAVHEVAENPAETILIMEYADGGSLFGLLQRRGRLEPPEAVRIVDQVLSALEAAHARGIVHRDVKPENVLLMSDGSVKLADFGVARDVRPEATNVTQGGPMGTLLYMSPEQVRGVAVDGRSDLYAVAVVLHQLLTGRFYLRIAGRDDFQVRQLILRSPAHLAERDLPPWVPGFLQRALAKDPSERYPTATEMRRSLKKAAGPAGKGSSTRAAS